MTDTHFSKFSENPALKYFGQWIPDDGLIDADDTAIYWNQTAESKIKEVAVVYFPRKKLRELGWGDHPAWRAKAAVYKNFNRSSGNCFSKWMSKGNYKVEFPDDVEVGAELGLCPDQDFQLLKLWGFESEHARACAIHQFAHIRECAWALEELGRAVGRALKESDLKDLLR